MKSGYSTRIGQVRQRTWLILTGALLVALYCLTILRDLSACIDGQRVFWLDDDMMISMGYGRSLARGDGLVWYPGAERVEGYSNLGWVLVMAGVHILPLPTTLTSLPILIMNVALAVVVLLLTARLIRTLAPDAELTLPAALLALTICSDLAHWTIYGLETPLQIALLLWLVVQTVDEAEAERPRALTFLLAGVLGIVRADGVVLVALVCLLALWVNPNRRKVLVLWPLALVFPLLSVVFRLEYYGWLLPNTYFLRLTGWSLAGRAERGFLYIGHYLRTYGIIWLISGCGAWVSRKRSARALWLIGGLIFPYVVYSGGDSFSDARFFAPWLPVWFALAFLSPYWWGWRMPSLRYLLSLSLLLGTVIIFAVYPFWQSHPYNADYARIGLTLRSETLPETTMAVLAAGTVPYFSERKAFDLLGKNDAMLAHQPIQSLVSKPGHNKFDFDRSLTEYEPDLVVPLGWPPRIEDRAKGGWMALGHLGWRDGIFFSSEFQAHYADSMVVVNDLFPIFVRSDSPERSRLMTQGCKETTEPFLTTLGMRRFCQLGK